MHSFLPKGSWVCLGVMFLSSAFCSQPTSQETEYENCVDVDGDGYGDGCLLGPDCDDQDINLTFSCNCEDSPYEGCSCNEGEEISCFEAADFFIGKGACQEGMRTCQDGQWNACIGQVLPKAEVCDNQDNDCDGESDEGLDCKADNPMICDEMDIEPSRAPPNLLLVVDRSGSMGDPIIEGGDRDKIEDTKDALNLLLEQGRDKIRFGFMQFPESWGCTPGRVSVECSDDSTDQILSKVRRLTANGGTPTGESLENADHYFGQLSDMTNLSFVLLLTDGMPTCPNGGARDENEEDNQLALDAISLLQEHGVDTFVIGLGEDLNSSNTELLDQMAVAGGRPRDGEKKYYMANSLEELQTAFGDIGGMVIGCSLTLDPKPEYPKYLWVYVDGTEVKRDPTHTDGWDYDEDRNQIIFYGQACSELKDGDVSGVEVKMGCAPEM